MERRDAKTPSSFKQSPNEHEPKKVIQVSRNLDSFMQFSDIINARPNTVVQNKSPSKLPKLKNPGKYSVKVSPKVSKSRGFQKRSKSPLRSFHNPPHTLYDRDDPSR